MKIFKWEIRKRGGFDVQHEFPDASIVIILGREHLNDIPRDLRPDDRVHFRRGSVFVNWKAT